MELHEQGKMNRFLPRPNQFPVSGTLRGVDRFTPLKSSCAKGHESVFSLLQ